MSIANGAATSVTPPTTRPSTATGAVPGTAASFLPGGVSGGAPGGVKPVSKSGGPSGVPAAIQDIMGALGKSAEEIAANLKGVGDASKGASMIAKAMTETTITDNIEKRRLENLLGAQFAALSGQVNAPTVPQNPMAARALLQQFGLPGA